MNQTELIERLERLERAHRRLKGFTFAAVVMATALATIYATQPIPDRIQAHMIEVVDNSGNVRARMAGSRDQSSLSLFDEQENVGVLLLVMPEGKAQAGSPRIILHDPQGFEMDLGSTQTTTLTTGETQQTSAASIVMIGNDKEHRVIWKAP